MSPQATPSACPRLTVSMRAQHKPGVFSPRPFQNQFTASPPTAPATFFCRKERAIVIVFRPRFAVAVSPSPPFAATRRSRAFGHRSLPAPSRHAAASLRLPFACRLPFAAFARLPLPHLAGHASNEHSPAASLTTAPPQPRLHAASAPRPVRPSGHRAQRFDEVGGLGIGEESPPRGRGARSAAGLPVGPQI